MWEELRAEEPDAHGETDPSSVGLVLEGRYRVEGLLARGGMGEVFRGRDIKLDRPIAIKFLAERFRSDVSLVKRFIREARAAAKLYHPNTVTIHSVGEEKGRPFFVMQFVEGQSVAELIRAHGRIPLRQAVGIALDVCRGLEHIHEHRFVHRDIKPQNLMVDPKGRCIILDFGILRVLEGDFTQTGMAAGTPDYMSPEQADDARKVDPRSDIYSLGVTFFEMITGRLPFLAESSLQRLLKHQSEPPPRPTTLVSSLPPEVNTIIQTSMAKNPEARYQTAAELAQALRALTDSTSGAIATDPEVLLPSPDAPVIRGADGLAAATPTLTAPPASTPAVKGSDVSPSFVSGESLRSSSSIVQGPRRRWLTATLVLLAAGAALVAWYLSRAPGASTPRSRSAASLSATTAPSRAPSAAPSATIARPSDPGLSSAEPAPQPTAGAGRDDPAAKGPVPVRKAAPPSPAPRRKVVRRARRKPRGTSRATHAKTKATTAGAAGSPPSATPLPATLVVTSFPSGVTARANGTVLGKTPISGHRLPAGSYDLTLSKDGYRTWKETVALSAGKIRTVAATLTALPATLRAVVLYQGKTTWATVSINGEAVGDTHAVKRQLPPGTYRVTAFRRGYRRAQRKVTLTPGASRMVRLILEKE